MATLFWSNETLPNITQCSDKCTTATFFVIINYLSIVKTYILWGTCILWARPCKFMQKIRKFQPFNIEKMTKNPNSGPFWAHFGPKLAKKSDQKNLTLSYRVSAGSGKSGKSGKNQGNEIDQGKIRGKHEN